MMNEEVRLGQWWRVRLTKRDLCVRLESRRPDGGWIARVMSHGRKVTIKSAAQLLERCDKNTVAESRYRSQAVSQEDKVAVQEPLAFLSLLDAAAVVLLESKVALTTREIIALVVERRLWKSTGATPWATLNAALNRDIQANGMQSRFIKTERGKFALR